jgi:SAM-dependent methyltransferase
MLPEALRNALRRVAGIAPRPLAPEPAASAYDRQLAQELSRFETDVNVHDLPRIFHYWSNRYLRPKFESLGFSHPDEFFANFLERAYQGRGDGPRRFVSIGAGNCDTEVRVAAELKRRGRENFVIECVEVNPAMLRRGSDLARTQGVAAHILAVQGDFNQWTSDGACDAVMANQSLHHVTNLEGLFEAVGRAIDGRGLFAIADMIGRNGHQRWPEALQIVREFWEELPGPYRYNVQLRRQEDDFLDWDCSSEGFEGIRSQDILPLMVERFSFDLFAPYANVIDPFVDRNFGHHFDADRDWDRSFIDRVHARDELEIRRGTIKPTHLVAVLGAGRPGAGVNLEGMTPRSCLR